MKQKRLIVRIFACLMGLCLFCPAAMGEYMPYTLPLEAAVPIFQGPSYDEGYARIVGEDGVYTIMEERWDEEGSLWGRLKSGVGWVNLTALQSPEWQEAPLTACFADHLMLNRQLHLKYLAEDSDYTVEIAFLPREEIWNVQLFMLDWHKWGYEPTEIYCTIDRLSPSLPLIAGVVFYGDMTTYGLSFLDGQGNPHAYSLSISGRNGQLLMEPWEPYTP